MKRYLVFLLFILVCSPFLGAQKTRYGQGLPKARPGVDYPVSLHISGIRVRSRCTGSGGLVSCGDVIYADATMNGRKIELMGTLFPYLFQAHLHLGDIAARLLNDSHQSGDNLIDQEYEVAFLDKTIWRCTVTGISE